VGDEVIVLAADYSDEASYYGKAIWLDDAYFSVGEELGLLVKRDGEYVSWIRDSDRVGGRVDLDELRAVTKDKSALSTVSTQALPTTTVLPGGDD
jgi:hypothetical protein